MTPDQNYIKLCIKHKFVDISKSLNSMNRYYIKADDKRRWINIKTHPNFWENKFKAIGYF